MKLKSNALFIIVTLAACSPAEPGSQLLESPEEIDQIAEYTEGCTLHERDTRFVTRTEVLSAGSGEQALEVLRDASPMIRSVAFAGISRATGETVTAENFSDYTSYIDDLSIESLAHSKFPTHVLYAANVGVGGGNGTYITFRAEADDLVLVAETFDGDLHECEDQYYDLNRPEPTPVTPRERTITVECYARGHHLRQTSTDSTNAFTDSRLVMELAANDESAVMTSYFGHVSAKYTWDGAGSEASDDEYYGHFLGRDKASSLSPRASAYPDSEYYRFREFNADLTSRQDGGGMWGYLVIEKSVREQGPAKAHYVFQAGDHMGGTIDLTCTR